MARAAPEKVFQEALKSLTDVSESLKHPQRFYPAGTFQGYKEGFYFTKGHLGLG